jgi:hypothetical protein
MMRKSLKPWSLFIIASVTALLAYWPSLHGAYVFDDYVYFVDNVDVHVTALKLTDWLKAALEQAGTNQFRALSMLSFAANYYFTGLDPFWPRLTNIAIHLVNGLLLFLLLRELFRLRNLVNPHENAARFNFVAAVVASLWLLLPINFTGVAYIAQRMESLANMFIFLGLYWYLRLRCREYVGDHVGTMLLVCISVGMALGFCAKETGVMLPLYTACIEFSVTRLRNADGRYSRSVLWTHGALLATPLLAGLVWISTWIFHSQAHVRAFSVGERVLSEPRVLVDYVGWSLFPNINSLSFYHDDIAVSHGLFDPPTTAAAILALAAWLAYALWKRRSMPLFCLGTLWFFAGHVLTATVIMLELAFEHRNYFASAGLLLAIVSPLAFEPGLRSRTAQVAIVGIFAASCVFTTFLRAEEWSHPLRFAYAEALKRPASARAQYELARTLIIAAGENEQSPLLAKSVEVLQKSAYLSDSGIAPLQALIFVNRHDAKQIDPRWWEAIAEKLQSRAPTITDLNAVTFLFHCQQRGECPAQTQELLGVFITALRASDGNVDVMSAYADFALSVLHDAELAERMSRAVVAAKPQVPIYHANLVHILIAIGKFDEAEAEIDQLKQLNLGGSYDSMIADLRANLRTARATTRGSDFGGASSR